MALDAIILADSGVDSFSGTSSLKLTVDGHIADIQTVYNFVANDGQVRPPIEGQGNSAWSATPKLNGIFLGSYLSGQGFTVELIDCYLEQREAFMALLARNPRAILVSTTFILDKRTLVKMTADIRSLAPHIPIIAGGPFVHLSYSILERVRQGDYPVGCVNTDYLFLEAAEEPSVDLFIVSARGEEILGKALALLRDGRPLIDLPNTARLVDGTYAFSDRVDDVSQPQPPIDWGALPQEIFSAAVVPIQASVGCPFNCAFCNFVKDRKLMRAKSAQELIAEMRQVKARGAKYIWFVDDNFRLGKTDLEAVCRSLIAADLDLRWMTFIRASVLDDVDPYVLRRAGCIEVQLGLESADALVLENMNKKASPELYERVVTKLLRAGVNCSCYLIFGFPGETTQSVQRTIDFMKKFESPDFEGSISWSFFPFVLAPLSPIYEPEMRAKYQLSGYLRRWQHASMNIAEAARHTLDAFFAIDTSGSIYRGDNLDMLHALPARRRNQFHALRHSLAKAVAQGKADQTDMLHAFRTLFNTPTA